MGVRFPPRAPQSDFQKIDRKPRYARQERNQTLGRAKREGVGGEGIFARPRFSAAAEFRISLCEMRRLFTIFDFWCSIEVIEKKYH
ncbi:MAG: hypothetical protein G01um101433_354 [Parcubacteria group bacterium Gr01-1014_33]|nr:MAG: hypothetical protein G01um101433_354 [Parcubacteria group bacterium Gr01-1014_33]